MTLRFLVFLPPLSQCSVSFKPFLSFSLSLRHSFFCISITYLLTNTQDTFTIIYFQIQLIENRSLISVDRDYRFCHSIIIHKSKDNSVPQVAANVIYLVLIHKNNIILKSSFLACFQWFEGIQRPISAVADSPSVAGTTFCIIAAGIHYWIILINNNYKKFTVK